MSAEGFDHQLVRDYLEDQYLRYNNPSFIENDPVSVPHAFTKKEDIEIAGFLTATISWGNRPSIIRSAMKLMAMMDHEPADFVKNASDEEIRMLATFYHRTFNGTDCVFFLKSLKNIFLHHGGLEACFSKGSEMKEMISGFRRTFLKIPHEQRSEKHVADPGQGSGAKRILMFLRWMVRNDNRGVDFGLWQKIRPSQLSIPLDLHSGNAARELGLLKRKYNDWKAVEELTAVLRTFDPEDPVKYDFALFGPMGKNFI